MEDYRSPAQASESTQQPRRRRRTSGETLPVQEVVYEQPQPMQQTSPQPETVSGLEQPAAWETFSHPQLQAAWEQPHPLPEAAGQQPSAEAAFSQPQPEPAQPDPIPPQPPQEWQARPGFAPEQRTVRQAPVQEWYHYAQQPAQEAPQAAPVASPRVTRPPMVTAPEPPSGGAAAAQTAQARTAPRQRPRQAAPGPQGASAPQAASYFDGKLHQLIGYTLLGILVTVLTLGICYPWALCKQYGWRIRHTVVEGRRLAFDGKATQLIGKWLLWLLLCIVTLGIYSLWVGIALEKWRVKHTHFAGPDGR